MGGGPPRASSRPALTALSVVAAMTWTCALFRRRGQAGDDVEAVLDINCRARP